MADCLIAFGANLGDRQRSIESAIDQLAAHPEIELRQVSQMFETAPVGGPGEQGRFLNGALTLATTLVPERLLEAMLATELELGRQRVERWSARTIDLDLLLYDQFVQIHDRLTIPHPRFLLRRFALEPSVSIAGDMIHPLTHWTLSRHLSHIDRSHDLLILTSEDQPLLDRVAGRLLNDFPNRFCLRTSTSENSTERPRVSSHVPENGIRISVMAASPDVLTPGDARRAKLIVRLGQSSMDEQNDGLPVVRVMMDRQLTMPVFRLCTSDIEAIVTEVGAATEALG